VTTEQFDFDGSDDVPAEVPDLQEYYRGYVPAEHFPDIVAVWRRRWDEHLGVCPPEPVTEAALAQAGDTSRMVAHYFQPHAPYIGEHRALSEMDAHDTDMTGGAVDADVWAAVREGDISDDELRTLYRSNLRRAMAAVAELVRASSFERYVITADHGEALGEYGLYNHPRIEYFHPATRIVPWVEVSTVADDAPGMWDYEGLRDSDADGTADRLRELGYLS
jgi:hypothetical protein